MDDLPKDTQPNRLKASRARTISITSSIQDNFGSVTIVTKDASVSDEDDVTQEVSNAPDGGWGWVILAASFMAYATQGFVFVGSSVLYVSLVEYFQSDRGVTGWILSLYSFTGNILGVAFGALMKRYGTRNVGVVGTVIGSVGIALCYCLVNIPYLCFTYGVIAGIGSTLTTMAASVSLQQYFDKKRTLATGIGTTGLSLGGLISAPIINALLEYYGLSGTYLIISGIWLHNAIFTALFRPLRSKQNKQTSPDPWKKVLTDMCDFSVLKNIQLVLFLLGTFLFNFGTMGFYGHYFSRMTYLGIDRDIAIILQVTMMVSTALGRIIFSFVGNLKTVDRSVIYAASVTAGGLVVFSFPVAKTTIPVAMYGSIHGICSGCYFAVQLAYLVDVTGMGQISKVMGVLHMTFGVVTLTAVPLTGFIFDVSRSYDLPYFIIGAIHVSGGVLLAILAVLRRTKWKPKPDDTAQG